MNDKTMNAINKILRTLVGKGDQLASVVIFSDYSGHFVDGDSDPYLDLYFHDIRYRHEEVLRKAQALPEWRHHR